MTNWIMTMSEYNDLARLSRMKFEDIRALWDEYDGCNAPQGISGEMIHYHLNIMGDGAYCAC